MWLITIICLVGTFLNCKKSILCFAFWAVGNILWLIYDIYSGLYSRAFLDFVQLLFAVYGAYEWRFKK